MPSSIHRMIIPIALCALLICPLVPHAANQKNELTFLHYWTGGMNGGVQEMVNAYNTDNPQHTVRATEFEHESFKVAINGMLASDTPPDFFSYWAGARVQTLVDRGLLTPIDSIWDGELTKTFPSTIADACTYNGKKYAIPITQHYVAFFYNKHIFKKLNLIPPRTWSEFLTLCTQIQKAGITPIALGARERWPAQFWFDYLLLRTAGPAYQKKLMAGEAAYTEPELVTVFEEWAKLLKAGYFNTAPNTLDWAEAAQLVHSGEAAMTLMGTWVMGLFDTHLRWKQETDYDFFRFPLMHDNVPITAVGPIDVLVAPHTVQVDHIQKPLSYFTNPGPQMLMSRGSGALSPSRAIPPSFYTNMQQRILSAILDSQHWSFSYDLAAPPEIAEAGLELFKQFIAAPDTYPQLLSTIETEVALYFKQLHTH